MRSLEVTNFSVSQVRKLSIRTLAWHCWAYALELRAGVGYEELLRRRIFEPLGMTSTTITLNDQLRSRRATGYNPRLLPVLPWTGKVIIPAGGVNSTATDTLKFAAAVLDPQSPMKRVFARMTSVKRPIEESRDQQTLGWGLFRLNGNEMLGHSGGNFGFESRLVVDTTRKRAVIAWINGRGAAVNDLVGLALDRAGLAQ
jgi:CubicO group peptidase (beta-lactamase class C family)